MIIKQEPNHIIATIAFAVCPQNALNHCYTVTVTLRKEDTSSTEGKQIRISQIFIAHKQHRVMRIEFLLHSPVREVDQWRIKIDSRNKILYDAKKEKENKKYAALNCERRADVEFYVGRQISRSHNS